VLHVRGLHVSSKPFAWKFFRQYLRLICAAVGRKASVKPDIVALRPSTLFKPLPESGEARRHFRIVQAIRDLGGRYIVVLVRTQRPIVQREVPTSGRSEGSAARATTEGGAR
jgi:hypothetical protein